MSSSSNEEDSVEPVNQENYELNLAHRFNFNTIQDGPRRGSVVLCFVGFEVVRLVGINPGEARVGDIAVEVAHNGFLYPSSGLVESDGWNRRLGLNLRATDQLLFHFLPCVEWHLIWQKEAQVYQGSGTSGSPSQLFHPITLYDCTYQE